MRKVVVYVSLSDAGHIRELIERAGAGRLGNYSTTLQRGEYVGSIRSIDETRIEFACDDATYSDIVREIERVSPQFAVVESWALETVAPSYAD